MPGEGKASVGSGLGVGPPPAPLQASVSSSAGRACRWLPGAPDGVITSRPRQEVWAPLRSSMRERARGREAARGRTHSGKGPEEEGARCAQALERTPVRARSHHALDAATGPSIS